MREPDPESPRRTPSEEERNWPAERAAHDLLLQQARAREALERLRDEFRAPPTHQAVRALGEPRAHDAGERIGRLTGAIEEALRAVRAWESVLRDGIPVRPAAVLDGLDLPSRLPPSLVRFLAERSRSVGFECELRSDPVRGWILRWKEFAQPGVVRGAGQIYERPYAWMDE